MKELELKWLNETDQYMDDALALTHLGDEYDRYLNAVVPPIFMNSLHAYHSFEGYRNHDMFSDDSFVYGRDSNPTVRILERKVAELEHGSRAVAFASGMAAFSAAVLGTCKAGDHVISMRNVYGSYKGIFDDVFVKKFQMTVSYVSGTSLQEIEDAVRENTALLILESPSTFVFGAADLRAIAELAHRKGFKTYIDNSCSSPIFQKPLDMGIDISMHTISKFIGGHSDIIGGILVSKDEELMRKIMLEERVLFGAILGPMEAWLAIRGLRTLELRMQRSMETAVKVADFLEGHEKVKKVYHTSLPSHPQAELIKTQQTGHTGLMSFELNTESEAEAVAFIDRLKLFAKGCSWGGHESLAIMPLIGMNAEETQFIGADRLLIRIYCGLEGAERLIADLSDSLDQIKE